jgi:hypothetical protein
MAGTIAAKIQHFFKKSFKVVLYFMPIEPRYKFKKAPENVGWGGGWRS